MSYVLGADLEKFFCFLNFLYMLKLFFMLMLYFGFSMYVLVALSKNKILWSFLCALCKFSSLTSDLSMDY